jgi:ribonuclease P protein component
VIRSEDQNSRTGFVVPKHHRTAVERNKVKRRLREVIRVVRAATPLKGDSVVVAGPRAYTASFDALQRELTTIWNRAAVRRERE